MNLLDKLLDMTLFQKIETNLKIVFSGGVMADNLGCDLVLLSSQRFKRLVNTILDITSFDLFTLDIPKKLERMFYS